MRSTLHCSRRFARWSHSNCREEGRSRAESLRRDLSGERDDEERQKNQTGNGIAELQRHRNGAAARLANGRRQDLDHPEHYGDLRHLTGQVNPETFICARIHGHHAFSITHILVGRSRLAENALMSIRGG